MTFLDLLTETATSAGALQPAQVTRVDQHGSVLVRSTLDDAANVSCDLLQTAQQGSLQLAPGDEVLVWLPTRSGARGVVLGRIGPSRIAEVPADAQRTEELVLEARQNLTLRCGEGSITIRADGKILIKGTDLVSSARRMNRIKGGAVSIN
jgi:hypothetical protein